MKTIQKLQYITQAKTPELILKEVNEVLDAGVLWLQLRIKDKSIDYLKIAEVVQKITQQYKATLIINDRVDVAKQINADGVHLGLTDTPIPEARIILGENKIIGGTANTLADAKNVELFKADYIGLGPYQHTTTKSNLSPVLGLKGYQDIIPKTKTYGWDILSFNIPIIAIGGLQLNDIDLLKSQTGIFGIAVSSLIYNAKHKKSVVQKILQLLDEK